jgi:hypothetical protein
MATLASARNDDLLNYSAYHAFRVINEHNEHLAAHHLAKMQALHLGNKTRIESFILQMKLYRNDYNGSIPQAQIPFRDPDCARILVANLTPDFKQIVNSQLFSVPDTQRTFDQVVRVLETEVVHMRNRGELGSTSAIPPPAAAPPPIPVAAQHAPLAIGMHASTYDDPPPEPSLDHEGHYGYSAEYDWMPTS